MKCKNGCDGVSTACSECPKNRTTNLYWNCIKNRMWKLLWKTVKFDWRFRKSMNRKETKKQMQERKKGLKKYSKVMVRKFLGNK